MHRPGPNQTQPDKEVCTMADGSQYLDSACAINSDVLKTEFWKTVPSYPQVLVSNYGRVLPQSRYAPLPNGGYRIYTPKPVFGQISRAGRSARHERLITMIKGTNKQIPVKVHSLVCEAFHGPRPDEKAVVIHINENAFDNRAENLRWGSQRENMNMQKMKEYHKSGSPGSRVYSGSYAPPHWALFTDLPASLQERLVK